MYENEEHLYKNHHDDNKREACCIKYQIRQNIRRRERNNVKEGLE